MNKSYQCSKGGIKKVFKVTRGFNERNSGNHKLILWILSILLWGNLLTPISVKATEISSIERLAGATRIQTSMEIANKLNPGIYPAVVLASSANFHDALAGVPLAIQKEAPLLWVENSVNKSQDVLKFIKEHCDKKGTIYILGSEDVISFSFESALQGLGFKKEQIQRYGSKDRYENAVKIAQKVEHKGKSVYITSGETYAQAAGAAIMAGVQGGPILYLPSKGKVPDSVINYLNKVVEEGASLQIIGDSAVIPDAVLLELTSKVKGVKEDNLKRISGKDIYELTSKVNKQLWLSQTSKEKAILRILLTSGKSYVESLPGAVLAAQSGAPLIFVDKTIPQSSVSLLKDIYKWNNSKDTSSKVQITVLGGADVIPQKAVAEADLLLTKGESMKGKAQVWTYAVLNPSSEPSYGVKGEGNSVIVSDSWTHTIQVVGKDKVTVLAGTGGALDPYGRPVGGYKNGLATAAKLNNPKGLAIDGKGVLYVTDSVNGAIRIVDQKGNVKTLVKGLNYPTGIVVSASGDLYVTETLAHRIIKINSKGKWTVLAGGEYPLIEDTLVGAFADGKGKKAKFNEPQGLAIDDEGNLYVADTGNQRIRKISPNGVVTTLAGSGTNRIENTSYIQGGYVDGKANAAQFNFPKGLAVGKDKTVYVADSLNHCIRVITPKGNVMTLAGAMEAGNRDGAAVLAQFNTPSDVLLGENGSLFIIDQGNALIRQYIPASK